MTRLVLSVAVAAVFAFSGEASATPFFFSTGDLDGRIATATRPESSGKFEIETGDDFVVAGGNASVTSATFKGLIPTGVQLSSIGLVRAEIYRVFPTDSDVSRTSGPPLFSTSRVPTRVNSPADVAFASRETGAGLTFTPGIIQSSFTAANSVLPGGIHPIPNQLTTGQGPVTGQLVQFNVLFTTPFSLSVGHYFFVPQVELTGSGDFLWLSSIRPIVPPGTSFAPDLQSWTRDQQLDPDWLRVGTDIVGGTTFNAAFTLAGDLTPVPEPATLLLFGMTAGGLGVARWRQRRRGQSDT